MKAKEVLKIAKYNKSYFTQLRWNGTIKIDSKVNSLFSMKMYSNRRKEKLKLIEKDLNLENDFK